MKHRCGESRGRLGIWLALGSSITTISAVVTFAFLHLVADHVQAGSPAKYRLLLFVVTFFSIAVVVGTVSALFNRAFNRCVSQLTRGLRAVAEGGLYRPAGPLAGGSAFGCLSGFQQDGPGAPGGPDPAL